MRETIPPAIRMKHRIVFFLLSCLLVAGCSSKPTRTQNLPSPNPEPAPQVLNPAPPPPTTPEFGPQPLPPGVEEKKPSERPRIALVMGGAGVASFGAVGLLKRLQEEGIQIDFIVTTGWPTLFALGSGFSRSVHDLEWFAMRLQEKDFSSSGMFELNKDYASQDKLSVLIERSFPQKDLADSRIPIVVSAGNTEPGEREIFDKGDWKMPLLKTMSVPGIYRPYPQGADLKWVNSVQAIDVDEAVRRGARVVVAVEMYDDYFNFLKSPRKNSDQVFRQLYLTHLRNSLAKEFKSAQITGRVALGKPPSDFASKRAAILAGYREGTRIAKELQKFSEANKRR